MVKAALFGHGKMGKMVERLAPNHHIILAPLNEADVVIDFSHASVVLDHIAQAAAAQKPIIIGTTGWEKQISHARAIIEQHHIAALYSPNFSLGIALFHNICRQTSKLIAPFPEYAASGIEMHHAEKKDAPSGTAKKLGEAFTPPLAFSCVRCGHIPGTHKVLLDSPFDTITLTHEARNREGFANGALQAAKWIIGKHGWYTFDEMVRSLYSIDHALS